MTAILTPVTMTTNAQKVVWAIKVLRELKSVVEHVTRYNTAIVTHNDTRKVEELPTWLATKQQIINEKISELTVDGVLDEVAFATWKNENPKEFPNWKDAGLDLGQSELFAEENGQDLLWLIILAFGQVEQCDKLGELMDRITY